jgi:DDE superfamily endonuclease
VCFDEWGPLEIRPIGGVTWARRGRPARMRATYRRLHGTEQFFGFYDVHADCLDGLFRKRKRLPELFEAFERLRQCYPRTKLYVVMDNLHQLHDHPRFLALLKKLRIHPVWTPTEASWLNLIEAHFGVLKRFTLANTDDPSHSVRRRRVYRYLHYRHRSVGTENHGLARIRQVRPVKLEQH